MTLKGTFEKKRKKAAKVVPDRIKELDEAVLKGLPLSQPTPKKVVAKSVEKTDLDPGPIASAVQKVTPAKTPRFTREEAAVLEQRAAQATLAVGAGPRRAVEMVEEFTALAALLQTVLLLEIRRVMGVVARMVGMVEMAEEFLVLLQ